MRLTQSHINYFMDNYGVDVSKVRLIESDLECKDGGRYRTRTPNCIYLDTNNIKAVNEDAHIATFLITTTIVHELTHWMQYVHGIYSFINTSTSFVELVTTQQHLSYADRDVEFDAIMSELKYLYYCNRDKLPKVLPIIKDYAVQALAKATVQSIRAYCKDINEGDEWCRGVLHHVINTRKIKNIS